MKIAFLINSLSDGGAEKVLKTLIEALFNEGFDVELICIEKKNAYELDSRIKVSYLTDFSFEMGKVKSLLIIIPLAFKLMLYLKNNKINLVQSHLFRASYVNLVAKFLFRSSHVAQVVNHSVISRLKEEGSSGLVNLFLIRCLYPFSDLILSVSKIVQDDMESIFNFKNKKIIIHNPFDIDTIKGLSLECVDDFVFSRKKKYIICIGRLIPLKRNADLLHALSALPQSIEVIFLGEGPEKHSLELLVTELNIVSRVHFLGWVCNPYKYIKNSDVLVSTSSTESFGNTIIESFACNVPVISSACGGPSEIIRTSCGVLFPVGDVLMLRKSIERVLFDTAFRLELIGEANTRSKDFSLSCVLNKYKEILTG